jgi:hypothetical protein
MPKLAGELSAKMADISVLDRNARAPQLYNSPKTGDFGMEAPYFRIFRFDPASAEQYN